MGGRCGQWPSLLHYPTMSPFQYLEGLSQWHILPNGGVKCDNVSGRRLLSYPDGQPHCVSSGLLLSSREFATYTVCARDVLPCRIRYLHFVSAGLVRSCHGQQHPVVKRRILRGGAFQRAFQQGDSRGTYRSCLDCQIQLEMIVHVVAGVRLCKPRKNFICQQPGTLTLLRLHF